MVLLIEQTLFHKWPHLLKLLSYDLSKRLQLFQRQKLTHNLLEPKLIFKGSATNGAKAFPANVNVAAAVGLAGIGADKTKLEIWADPNLKRNTHKVQVDSDSAVFEMSIQNVQTPENPGTGKITGLSVVACLRGLKSSFKIGT